MADEVVGARST